MAKQTAYYWIGKAPFWTLFTYLSLSGLIRQGAGMHSPLYFCFLERLPSNLHSLPTVAVITAVKLLSYWEKRETRPAVAEILKIKIGHL